MRRLAVVLLPVLVLLAALALRGRGGTREPNEPAAAREPGDALPSDRKPILATAGPRADRQESTSEPGPEPSSAGPAADSRVSGRVVGDVSGVGVAGARVVAWDDRDSNPSEVAGGDADDAGRFEIQPVPADRPVDLVVTAKGHVPREVSLPVGRSREGVEIRLGVGGVLEGEVRDADGSLVAGATITVLGADEPLPPRRQPRQWYVFDEQIRRARSLHRTATSDDAGRFEVRGIPLETAVTAVFAPTDRLEARSLPATFTSPGERLRRDVSVPRPGSLRVRFAPAPRSGTTADARPEDVEPPQVDLTTATVWLTSQESDRGQDGDVLFEGLTPGSYRVEVFPRNAPSEERSVEVRAGERAELEIGSPSGAVLAGVVVTEGGKPVPHARLSWEGAKSMFGDADEQGRFRLEGIVDRRGTLRVAEGPFFLEDLAGVVLREVEPGVAPVRVVLPPSPLVTGRIVGMPPGVESIRGLVISKTIIAWMTRRLAQDGRFEIPTGETATPALVVFERDGFAPIVVEIPPLRPGERRDVGDLRFGGGRTIAGVVRDGSGRPVAGAKVLIAERWIDAERWTAADGSYRFERMPDRATEVRVDAEGFPVHVVTIPPGADPDEAEIVVDRGGLLRVRVLDQAGGPVARARVLFRPEGEYAYDVDFDKTGRVRDADASGQLEVRLQARGHHVTAYAADGAAKGEASSVAVRAGETVSVEIRLR